MSKIRIRKAINRKVERVLWARAAARCQFSGCNTLLDRSPVTQEDVNLAQMAHIYSFSEKGPRGHEPFKNNLTALDEVGNLLLVCHGCHQKIDADQRGEKRYSAELLQAWKAAHEKRIREVTAIAPGKSSHVVLFDSRIGDERPRIQFNECVGAMFPNWYPASHQPITLTMTSRADDSTPGFWAAQEDNLRTAFRTDITSRIESEGVHHFSVFALASQPLLILLGSLLTEKTDVVVYQPHREPRSWEWQPHPEDFGFEVIPPADSTGIPALVISLSGTVDHARVRDVLPGHLSIWELTIADRSTDFLRSEQQLQMFRQAARKLIEDITRTHPGLAELPIFPAMPASCAIELGRVKMPKTNLIWHIYDQNHKHQKFIPTLKIGGPHE